MFGSTDGRKRCPWYHLDHFPAATVPVWFLLTTFQELSVCVWFSIFSPPLHSGFCFHLFLADTVQKISAIAESPVPCNRCTHPLCLTLGSVDHSALKTILLQFTCCNILFPPALLVTPLWDFSNYCSSMKQVSKNARFLIPSLLCQSRPPFGTLPSPMDSWTRQRLWLAHWLFQVKNVLQALDLYLHFQSRIWHFCQDISQVKQTP